MSDNEPLPEPDVTMIVKKSKGVDCAMCEVANRIAIRKGVDKHVLLITVELESDFEKKLAGVEENQPQVEVLEGKEKDGEP